MASPEIGVHIDPVVVIVFHPFADQKILPQMPRILTEMGRVQDVLEIIHTSEFSLVDHFTLPDDDWWRDFYEPMERRPMALRHK